MAEKKKRKSEVDLLAEQITVDLSNWRMMHHWDWSAAAKTMNREKLHSMMADAITDWPFEGDCRVALCYDQLFPKQWRAALRAVDTATTQVFQEDDPDLDEGDQV
jgi:hypothetical protein